MFRDYVLLLLINFALSSPTFEDTSISHGTEVRSRNKLPYHVAIERDMKHVCGGAIINHNTVLTAAHCLALTSDPTRYRVRIGSVDLNTGGIKVHVTKVINHPYFGPVKPTDSFQKNDIGIVWLREDILRKGYTGVNKIDMYIKRAFLAGSTGVVSGWGITHHYSRRKSEKLLYAKITIYPQNTCMTKYPDVIESGMFCAGDSKAGACPGDSGGPLVVNRKLVGIVSFGGSCGSGKPSIFANVQHYHPWILSHSIH